MTADDQTFRVVLTAGFAVVFPVALFYRVRSQMTREPLDRRQEGAFILLTLRPIGLAGMLATLAFMIDPAWMAWSSVPLPAALRWAGAGIGALGAALLLWAFASLGRNLTDTVVTRRAHTLVTHGPYRRVRHPFYDGVALLVVATALMTATWFVFVCGALAFALLVARTPIEEAHLLQRFGRPYEEYRRRTGRFLPRLP